MNRPRHTFRKTQFVQKFQTHRNPLMVLLVLALFAGLSGCGKQSTNPAAANETVSAKDAPVIETGAIGKSLLPVLNHRFADACDHQHETIEKEIASALDQKSDDLVAAIKNTTGLDSQLTSVPFGSSVASKYKSKEKPADKWISYSIDWDKVYRYYQKIKDTPVDSSWVALNSIVRSLVSDDVKRVVNRKNLELGRGVGPQLKLLQEKIDACVLDSKCVHVAFTSDDSVFVKANFFYSSFQTQIETAKTETEARTALTDFKKRVDFDSSYFTFETNASVEKLSISGHPVIKLPLSAADFSDEQKAWVKGAIEEVWKSDDITLEVVWKDPANTLFKILFDLKKPGERSYTNYTDKLVQLYPQFSDRDVAHEIGHVLGFSDHYYETWSSKTCAYTTEYNEADLMGPSSGYVTADDWAELKSAYLSK